MLIPCFAQYVAGLFLAYSTCWPFTFSYLPIPSMFRLLLAGSACYWLVPPVPPVLSRKEKISWKNFNCKNRFMIQFSGVDVVALGYP